MNLLDNCTEKEIELIGQAGFVVENKNYTKEELEKCRFQIADYIMNHSSKNGDINKEYSNILMKIS